MAGRASRRRSACPPATPNDRAAPPAHHPCATTHSCRRSRSCSCRAHAPKDRGTVEDASDARAVRGRLLVLTDWKVRDFLERQYLDITADTLLLGRTGGGQPFASQRPHLLTLVPAPLLAITAQIRIAGRAEPIY